MKLLKIVILVICTGVLLFIGYKFMINDIPTCAYNSPTNTENIQYDKPQIQKKQSEHNIKQNELVNKTNDIEIEKLLKDVHANKLLIDNIDNIDKPINNNMSLKRKSRKKTDNTLRKIVNTILSNVSVRTILNIESTDKITKTYYKSVMIQMGLEPGQMKIKDMLQAIMVTLPPVSIIENILDEHFSLSSIDSEIDKDCVVAYLDKKLQTPIIGAAK